MRARGWGSNAAGIARARSRRCTGRCSPRRTARLAAKAFLHFPTDWDFLAYHLPGALATYGLTSYTPEPRLVAVIAGFPPLPRIVAGALVLATGRFSAAGALNLVAFAALVAGLVWLYGRAFACAGS